MTENKFRLNTPAHLVVCTIIKQSVVDTLVTDLTNAGYKKGADVAELDMEEIEEGTIHIGHGEETLKSIDPDGTYHGGFARVLRTLQKFTTGVDERTLNAVEEALTSGHYLIGVMTDGSDAQRDEVHALMQAHSGTHIFYAGNGYTQLLSGW